MPPSLLNPGSAPDMIYTYTKKYWKYHFFKMKSTKVQTLGAYHVSSQKCARIGHPSWCSYSMSQKNVNTSTLPYPTLPYPTLPYLITTLKLPYLSHPLTLYYPTLPYPTLPYPDPYPSLNLVPYSTLPYLTLLYSTFTVCSTLQYAFLPYTTNTLLPYPTLPLLYPTQKLLTFF